MSDLPFAELVPSNKAAIVAFSKLWDVAKAAPEYEHHRRFMVARKLRIPLWEALHGVDATAADGPAESTDASARPGTDPLDELIWQGGFVFSFATIPARPSVGWSCGYGRRSKDPKTGRVDLALSLPEDRRRLSVHGTHAFFNFRADSAAFSISAQHPIKVDAEMVTTIHNFRVLNQVRHIIAIGDMSYVFNYTTPKDQVEAFAQQRAFYMRNVLDMEKPPISATPTPSEDDVHLGPWRLVQTIGRGTESVIASAISRDGELVAVKELGKRNSAEEKRWHIERYESIRAQVRGEGAKFLITFYGHIESQLGVTYTFFQPLARQDFAFLLNGTVNAAKPVLLQLFLQALKGVDALHQAGFLHRDLKPANLGVCSMDPPHAVVLDLGSTTRVGNGAGLTPSPGCFGTIGYIAPEVESVHQKYGAPADIWSMGCIGLQLMIQRYFGPHLPWRMPGSPRFNPWRSMETFNCAPLPDQDELEEQRKIHKDVWSGLGDTEDPLENVLCGMLSERPHWRTRASQVIHELSTLEVKDI